MEAASCKFFIQDSFGLTDENIDEFEHNATTEVIWLSREIILPPNFFLIFQAIEVQERTDEKDDLDRLTQLANRAEKTLGNFLF